jgi:NAD(P)-dependent dehydrogenase (short-subunit alcohol dehydrogenase family)
LGHVTICRYASSAACRIGNVGSINGQADEYGHANYAAAKSGIHGFTKALAQEGAGVGVTVNTVAPGYVGTDMVQSVPPNILAKLMNGFPQGVLALLTISCAEFYSWSPMNRDS